jgi:UDP-2,3-diacylglucosamine hydrolase
MNTIFISDLHLSANQPELLGKFKYLLEKNPFQADQLYILGDFFDYWIGDDDYSDFHQEVKEVLKEASKTLTIYFMHGNRDFLIGANFLLETGCGFLPDPSIIQIHDKKTLLAHGDLYCLEDKQHLLFRKLTRMPSIQKLFLLFPLRARRKIAEKLRKQSQQHISQMPSSAMDVPREAILDLLKKQKVDQIIHGHTHQPSIDLINVDGQLKNRYVLSDWGTKGNALVCRAEGDWELVYF